MAAMNKKETRRVARKYFGDKSVSDIPESELEDVEVRTKKTLSAMLSLRLEEAYVVKLKNLAALQGVGISTMARHLLEQCLDHPGNQFFLQAMQDAKVKEAVEEIANGSFGKAPVFYIVSQNDLEHVGKLMNEAATRMVLSSLKDKLVTVSPTENKELYEKLGELEGSGSAK